MNELPKNIVSTGPRRYKAPPTSFHKEYTLTCFTLLPLVLDNRKRLREEYLKTHLLVTFHIRWYTNAQSWNVTPFLERELLMKFGARNQFVVESVNMLCKPSCMNCSKHDRLTAHYGISSLASVQNVHTLPLLRYIILQLKSLFIN